MAKKQKEKTCFDQSTRSEIVRYAKQHSAAEASRRFGIHSNTIYNWLRRFSQQGENGLQNQSKLHSKNSKLDSELRAKIISLKQEDPNITLQQIKSALQLDCSLNSISLILRNHHSTVCISKTDNPNEHLYYYRRIKDRQQRDLYILAIHDTFNQITYYARCSENCREAWSLFAEYFVRNACLTAKPLFLIKNTFFLKNFTINGAMVEPADFVSPQEDISYLEQDSSAGCGADWLLENSDNPNKLILLPLDLDDFLTGEKEPVAAELQRVTEKQIVLCAEELLKRIKNSIARGKYLQAIRGAEVLQKLSCQMPEWEPLHNEGLFYLFYLLIITEKHIEAVALFRQNSFIETLPAKLRFDAYLAIITLIFVGTLLADESPALYFTLLEQTCTGLSSEYRLYTTGLYELLIKCNSQAALGKLDLALKAAKREDNAEICSRTWQIKALIYYNSGLKNKALTACAKALESLKESNLYYLSAKIYLLQTLSCYALRNWQEHTAALQLCIASCEKFYQFHTKALALANSGCAAVIHGDSGRAIKKLLTAAEIHFSGKDFQRYSNSLLFVAQLYFQEHRFDLFSKTLNRVEQVVFKHKISPYTCCFFALRAMLQFERGFAADGLKLLQRAENEIKNDYTLQDKYFCRKYLLDILLRYDQQMIGEVFFSRLNESYLFLKESLTSDQQIAEEHDLQEYRFWITNGIRPVVLNPINFFS